MVDSSEKQFGKFSHQEVEAAVAAYLGHDKNKQAAARSLGMAESSFRRRMERAAELGMLDFKPAMPGFVITQTSEKQDADGNTESRFIRQVRETSEKKFEMPAHHMVKGVSTLVDPDNNIVSQWIKTREDNGGVDWVEVFKNAFAEYDGRAKPVPAPLHTDDDFINLFPVNDLHLNLLCWWREVGQSWDLKVAERVIGETIETVIARTRNAGTAIILGGGDLMHNDDNTNRTAKSGNVLDADGRHAKGIEVAQRLKVRVIEAALRKNKNVIVRILKGNHDEQSAVAIAHFLSAWFHNEPRVTVDLDQSLYWYHQFGKVMLAATHGHAAKLFNMPAIMAHRTPRDVGARPSFRYCHGFHVHHLNLRWQRKAAALSAKATKAPIPQDSW